MPRPHGGNLVNNFISSSKIDKDLFVLDVDEGIRKDIENISFGIFSPLKGFVNSEDFNNIVTRGRLANDLPWTIPIIFDVDDEQGRLLLDKSQVALRSNGEVFGLMDVKDLYGYNKFESAKKIFQTNDISHPGVHKFVNRKDSLLEADVKIIVDQDPKFADKYRLTPSQTRLEIENHGWKTIIAFQTRNVPHIAHEMLQKAALNIFDGLFINPLIGKKKTGDFKDIVILQAYTSLIDNYYPKSRVIFSTLHTEMKYAGPREAIHHAIMRQNFGCSHIIIGRDHAGVGNFYHPFAAHEIFQNYPDLEITPLFFPSFYYCKKCISYVNERICPHNADMHEELSGTKMRKMFASGQLPPVHLMRPEISRVILSHPKPFVE